MRIQHNVTALNAYRNLRGNNLNLAKNLEKLSSGYRINRAGDDAAGLAVSEKMRAQITGLDAATKNAQDGISLVQTAEGALTEVHSMLNRMVTLATQSANGTYDNEVDRANLQKEVASLKSEINRISESSNYNGIKLLDGSLASGAMKSKLPNVTVNGVTGQAAANGVKDVIEVTSAADYKFSGAFAVDAQLDGAKKFGGTAAGENARIVVKFNDENGTENIIEMNLVSTAAGGVDTAQSTVTLNGKKLDSKVFSDVPAVLKGEAGNSNITQAANTILQKVDKFSELFDSTVAKDDAGDIAGMNGTNAAFIITKAKEGGTKSEVTSILTNSNLTLNHTDNVTLKDAALSNVAAKIEDKITVHGAKIFAVAKGKLTEEDIKEATIEVNGIKFAFVNSAMKGDQATLEALKKAGIKEEHIIYSSKAGVADDVETPMEAKDADAMVKLINKTLGEEVASVGTTKTDIVFKGKNDPGTSDGLVLQIGDTADKFNKMSVSVDSMSSVGLNITSVDVSTQDKAAASIEKIKNAINSVSSTRGDLGALQNRLEHTINNLGVMHENITEAESRIRDTDMAKEMMSYAKNNILVQSATAMLAQANQLPQSVLQLLQ